MATITYPDFNATDDPPASPRINWGGLLRRATAFILGAVAVWVQVEYTWASLTSTDVATRVAPVLFAVSLASCVVMAEYHFRAREGWKGVGWLIVFLIALGGNLQNTVTRVSEVRALKSAAGEHAGNILQSAQDALRRAEQAEDNSNAQMSKFCEMVKVTTTTETNSRGKKRSRVSNTVRKSDAEVDPRCASWTETHTADVENSDRARARLASVTVSSSTDGVSPAAKSISMLTNLDRVKIDHALDFVQPLGLDALALVAFWTAFSPRPRERKRKFSKKQLGKPQKTGPVPVVKGIPQEQVTLLVERWLSETGLPIGEGMGAALKLFKDWGKLEDSEVTFVTFGRAFDMLGIERRSLNGRKVVAGRRTAAAR